MLSLTSLKKGGFVKLVAIFFSAYETITEFKQPKIIYFVITISESKKKTILPLLSKLLHDFMFSG